MSAHDFLPRRRAVTLKDVALRAGVSQMTASCVLNGAKPEMGVAQSTRERIVAVAQELGYRPNGLAKAMKSGRFGNVGLILSTRPSHSYLPDALLSGIDDALAERNLHLTLARLPDEQLTDAKGLPKLVRELMVDGLLMDYIVDVPPALSELIAQHTIPCIWLNSKRDGDCVFPDDEQGAFDATQHVLRLGHTRIAYAHPMLVTHHSAFDRRAGYERAMRVAGLAPQVVSNSWNRREIAEQWLHVLSVSGAPTAVVTYEDFHADVVVYAALRSGLNVPQALSLVACHERLVGVGALDVDTAAIPVYEMGRVAVEMLLEKIERPQDLLPPRALPMALLQGDTCAPAPLRFALDSVSGRCGSLGTCRRALVDADVISPKNDETEL